MREGSLYPYKIPSDFHGCTVNLSAIPVGRVGDEFYCQYFLTHSISGNYVNDFPDNASYLENVAACLQNLRIVSPICHLHRFHMHFKMSVMQNLLFLISF